MFIFKWFSELPRITQVIMLIGILILLIVIALNHTAEGNLTDLLLVVLTVVGIPRKRNKSE